MKLFKTMETTYNKFDETIRGYLSKAFNSIGMQYTHSQIFGVIFDGIKGVMQNAMFYIEDALNEQNIFKASRKQSVYSLAKLSGYEPNYGSSAAGTIIAKTKVSNVSGLKSSKIYIKHGAKIVNKNTGLTYIIYLPTDYYVIDISKPLINHEFKIVQGYIVKNSYVSKGTSLETIHISSYELFDKKYIKVTVDGVEWQQCHNLYDMSANSNQYLITIGYNNAFDIMFGDGIHGKQLKEGQNIIIKYIKHLGLQGNIMSTENSTFSIQDSCYDAFGSNVDGNEYISFSLKNCVSGGTNSDSIEFVRSMVGKNSRSLVLASEDNFKLFFKRFSFVGYVNCWSEQNSMTVTATCLKNISNEIKDIEDYYKLNVKSLLLEQEQKEMIQETLNNSKKAFAGITLKFEDPLIRRYAVICYVKPDNIYNKDIITNDIRKTLANYFMNTIEDSKFIPKSSIINELTKNNDHILSLDLDIISELAEQTFKNGYYEKYNLEYINGTYNYVKRKVIYEKETVPGLDYYGNISVDTNLEVPLLQGGFNYYPNKDNKNTSYRINTVQVVFI